MVIISSPKGFKQAEQFGLRKFYWENTDTYLIPEEEATPEVMQKVMELLRNGSAFDDDRELVMSIVNQEGEYGEPIEGKYMYFIRDVETWK